MKMVEVDHIGYGLGFNTRTAWINPVAVAFVQSAGNGPKAEAKVVFSGGEHMFVRAPAEEVGKAVAKALNA